MEIASAIKGVAMAASQFNNNRSSSNMGFLVHQLEILHTLSGRSDSIKQLHPNHMQTVECLQCLTDIMGNPSNKPALVLKCIQVLSNFAKDPELRNSLQETFYLDQTLAGILKTFGGLPDDQLTQECLRVLQSVTYGHRISFHESFVEDLLMYLVRQILAAPNEVSQHCLGILANLCHDNFPVQARIKSMDNARRLFKTICQHFNDPDLTTVIFALSAYTSLCMNEETGDNVFFTKQNFRHVLQMVFNVLASGKSMTTRCYAVDLVQDLVRNPHLQEGFEQFPNLPENIQNVLKMISCSSAQPVKKVFELLLSLCTVGSLRTCICHLLFSISIPPADQLNQLLSSLPRPECPPLVAAVCWGLQPLGTSSTTSLAALDFLKEMYEELLCGEETGLQSGAIVLLPALVQILKEPFSVDMPRIKMACIRLSKTLKLITALSSEDEIKTAVAELVKAEYFMAILDFQIANNRMLLNQCLAHKYAADMLEDWGIAGVETSLLTLELMSKIRRYVQNLDSCFLSLLQDNRIVPILAEGLTSSDRDLVQISLQLTCLGSTLENFPDVILGDAVAAANKRKTSTPQLLATHAHGAAPQKQLVLSRNKENILSLKNRSGADTSLQSICTDVDTSIQSLIEKMHSAVELKDLKTADVIDIYEHRLQSHQMKEDHLQDLLEAKSLALTQADRLIAQYRSRQARHGAEAHKMRCLFQDSERKSESLLKEMNELKLDKDRLKSDLDMLRHEKNQLELQAQELGELRITHGELQERCSELECCLTRVQQELKTTREMHEILQKHYESLKHQHDIASEQLRKLEEESKLMSRELKDKAAKLQETSKALQTMNEKHSRTVKDKEEVEQEKEELEKATDTLRGNIALLEQTKKELLQKVKSLEHMTQEQEIAARAYQEKVQYLETEVNKHTEIAALIHKLSSGHPASSAAPSKT